MRQDMRTIGVPNGRARVAHTGHPLPRWVGLTFLLAALALPQSGRAEPVPLLFDTCTPGTNVANMYGGLGPGYTGGLTMHFLHVATWEGTAIDARVTAVVGPNTEFANGATDRTGRGYLPNFKAATPGQPQGRLGFLYDGIGKNVSGITLTISFFDGTGDRRGQFSEPYTVPDFKLFVCDVDGEPAQAEWFDAFNADGLSSYATGAAPASVTATRTAAGAHFRGPARDVPETDVSGAVLLHYQNTSKITLAFGAEQFTEARNAVFAVIGGDLGTQMTAGLKKPTVVPASRALPPAQPAEPPAPPSSPALASALGRYPTPNVLCLDRLTPAQVPINVPFDYTLKVTNLTEAPVQDVIVTERLPQNFKLLSAEPQPRREGADLHWALGTLDPKAVREFKVSGVATTGENLQPCATVTFVVPISVGANVAVVEPKLVLAQTAPKETLLSDPIPAQIVVTNAGTGDLEDVKIIDTLPAGWTTLDGRAELVLDAGALTAGQSKQFTGSFKAAKTGEFVNKISASAAGGWKAEATAIILVRQPVLALTNTGPARQYLGRPITYEIAVTNKGDAPAAEAVVADTLPAGAQQVQASGGGEISGAKVVWPLGTLPVNASKTVSLTYTPAGAGALTQTATASAVGANTVTAAAATTIYGLAAIHLEVLDTDDPVPIGGRTTYRITVINQGSSPSHNVQITATVEDAEEIVATDGPTSVTVEGRTARCAPLATLAPEAKATWQVTVKALKAGDVRFRATMTTAELGRPVEQMEATQLYK